MGWSCTSLCILGALLAIGVALPTSAEAGKRDDPASASAFAVRIVRLIGENRYAEAWTSLYPPHQQVAPLDRYVECEDRTPIPGKITALRTLRTWNAPIRVAGLPNPIPGTKVTLRIVLAEASIAARTIVVKTVGLGRVAHHWVWFLPASRYASYLAGQCPP